MLKIKDSPKIPVIIVNYKGVKDTLECLESLKKCDYPNFEIIVVDNGSDVGQVETLREGGFIKLIELDDNYGFSKANNVAVEKIFKSGKSEYVYFLNNDTVVDPDFLNEAVNVLKKDPKVGIVASLSLQYANRDLVENAGHNFLNCGDFVPRGRGGNKKKFRKSCEVLGACSAGALYKIETLKQCGLYDEDFFMNYEDADLSLRCILYGWKCVFAPKSIIYHKGGVSVKKARDYNFNVRSLNNALKAYFYNTPWLVLFLNVPFLLIREIFVILVCVLFLRFKLLKIFIMSRVEFFKYFSKNLSKRRIRMKNRKVSSLKIWWMQKNFIPTYFNYFLILILKRQKSVLELEKDFDQP